MLTLQPCTQYRSATHARLTTKPCITYDPTPARALNTSGGSVELLLEGLNGTPLLLDSGLEGTVTEATAVALALRRSRSQVLPEERMVDVSCTSGRSVSGVMVTLERMKEVTGVG